jgi:hypothetical protein
MRADAMTTGRMALYSPNDDCIGILRYVLDEKDAFGTAAENGIYFVAINRAEENRRVVFDFAGNTAFMTMQHQSQLRHMMSGQAVCQLTKAKYQINDGLLEISMPGGEAVWLKIY